MPGRDALVPNASIVGGATTRSGPAGGAAGSTATRTIPAPPDSTIVDPSGRGATSARSAGGRPLSGGAPQGTAKGRRTTPLPPPPKVRSTVPSALRRTTPVP